MRLAEDAAYSMSKPIDFKLREEAEAATDEDEPAAAPPFKPDAVEARKAYESRVSRAKELAPMKKLDLSNLSLETELPQGDHQLTHREDTMLATPRAQNENAVLTVRGAPKHRTQKLMHLTPAALGNGPVRFAWQPGGKRLAVGSYIEGRAVVQLYARDGKLLAKHELCDSKPLWIDFDSKGESIAVRTEHSGIFLWDVGFSDSPPAPLHLAPAHTSKATFTAWSKICPQLAIGTSDGKVILYNRTDAVLQLHERKGTLKEEVTCGDWLFDNRLGLASGMRVKISHPVAEVNAKWESFSKFKLGGIGSKVPKHIRQSGTPTSLGFTLGYPPFIAVSLGTKYLLTFDTTRQNEDLGLTFPEDYGGICGFKWMPSNMLLVGLSNGYIVTVDFAALIALQKGGQLPSRVQAMATSRIFEEYITSIDTTADLKVACCGDAMVKVIRPSGVDLEVYLEVPLERKATVGQSLECVKWDHEGKAFACSSTDGHLYVHTVE
ncbi:hypothetical protein KFE25_007942 [Diacronema lutheri]|uniref:WDR19 first beta-propeller domain-containing protein n=1 Tax=Diacronema lutheri TaxID=2081491 RepID=A0A8J5XG99_DIALT|nr:hypothetical protein KFE25_007942 [Diacronema lutheri]